MRCLSFIVVILVALFSSGEGFARPVQAVETTLYFGLDLPDGGVVSDEQWAGFLSNSVTPRFPDGFTVLDAYGQWRDPKTVNAPIVREKTRVLIIVHSATQAASDAIEEIKSIYLTSFGQKSVFHTEAEVRLVE